MGVCRPLGCAVSLRNKLTPPIAADICGNYYTSTYTVIKENEVKHTLWPLAQYYQQKLSKNFSEKLFLPTVYDHKAMNELVKKQSKPKLRGFEEELFNSFMGEINFDTPSFIANEIFYLLKNTLSINLVSTIFKKRLYCNICYPEQYKDPAWIKKFSSLLHNKLVESD